MFTAIDSKKVKTGIDCAKDDEQYFCEICEGAVIQKKRGKKKAPHFAHKVANPYCDSWHSDMSEWHHQWQQQFPSEMREIVIVKDGIKHRADILINDTILEFQHSYITAEEYENRNNFYKNAGYKVIWLFDIQEFFQEKQITFIKTDSKHECDCYKWRRSKSLFHGYDIESSDTIIYFQFGSAECGKNDIKRLLRFDSEGSFSTDNKNAFDVPGFIAYVINGIPDNNHFVNEKLYKGPSTVKITSKNNKYCYLCCKYLHIDDLMPIRNSLFHICYKCIDSKHLDWRAYNSGTVYLGRTIPEIISSCDYDVIGLTNMNNDCSVKIGASKFRNTNDIRIYGYLKNNNQKSYSSNREEIIDANKPIWVFQWGNPH